MEKPQDLFPQYAWFCCCSSLRLEGCQWPTVHQASLSLIRKWTSWCGCIYHSLLIHPHYHFAHYFESKAERGLILKYLVSPDYTPPQKHGCGKITRWLGTAATLVMYHESFPSLLYFLQKSGSEIMCIISGDRRRRETGWFRLVSTSSGETKMLITLLAKLKAQTCFYKIHRLLYAMLILCTCTWDILEDAHYEVFKQVKTYLCKLIELGGWRGGRTFGLISGRLQYI